MPLPRSVARFNRLVTNRITGPLAPYLPLFGVVLHTGRRTGDLHRTPINVFARPGGYIIALTYGPNSDWVKNVLASGGCILETRGRAYRLTQPRLIHDDPRNVVPWMPRFILDRVRQAGVLDFLDLSVEVPARSAPTV